MKYEVEQKFRLADQDAISRIVTRVAELGGTWKPTEEHADTYYAHPCRNFAETDESLRIRSIKRSNDDYHFVTYKGPKINQETKTRRELELPLTPPDFGPEQMAELWQALGFRPVATVRKSRRKANLASGDWSFSVDMDDVDQVGQFVELDTSADESQLQSAQAAMNELATKLGLTEVIRKSYLGMLLENVGGQ